MPVTAVLPRSEKDSGECRDSLVLPSRPTVVGAVNIELGRPPRRPRRPPRTAGRGPAAERRPVRRLVAVEPHPGAERHEDLAAAVVRHRPGAGQAEPDPPGQPRAGGAVDRGVGDDDPDARPGRLSGAEGAGGSSRPTGTPATTSSSRDAEVGDQQHGDRVPLGGHPRGRADAALEHRGGTAAAADAATLCASSVARAPRSPRKRSVARRSASARASFS